MEKKNEAIQAFQSLSARMLALDPSDQDALAHIGMELENLLENSAPVPSEIESLLGNALQALQRIYEGTTGNPSLAIEAVSSAFVASAEFLGEEVGSLDGLNEATEWLASILNAPAQEMADEPLPADIEEADPCEDAEDAQAVEKDSTVEVPEAESEASGSGEPSAIQARLPEDADLELLGEFIEECLEHISAAEAALLELESSSDNPELINTIFRAFHTIKGTSGFLGLNKVQSLAHDAENLLDRAREGKIRIQGGYADLALKSCDALRTIIEGLEGVQPGGLLKLPANYETLMIQLGNPEAAGISDEVEAEDLRVGEILVGQGKVLREEVERAQEKQGNRKIGQALVDEKIVDAADVAKALRTQNKLKGTNAKEATVRVGTGRLDNLINMVGELVIAQSMVAQDRDLLSGAMPRLGRNVAHAGKIIRELQDLSMSLRMVPLTGTFQKMARLVRDLSHKAGKNVELITEGEDTEIDRNMVEVLNDPLVHMIRNSIDHGIESGENRVASGKDPRGKVVLRAFQAAGNVVIELRDDGKGLDREKIIAKSISRGLIEPGRELSDSEVFAMIFQPGFSTAEKITDISGRGVGMDVVKRSIESLRGRIEVSSQIGVGSTFTMWLPLTMAITDAMLIRVGSEQYLLPTVSIEYSFRPEKDMIFTVNGGKGEMVKCRGDLLPVFRLHRLFNVKDAHQDLMESLLIVVECDGRRCALMADEILGQQQVVIKALGEMFGQLQGVAGGSILGDGRVGLILDAAGLLQLAMDPNGASLAA